MAELYQVYGGFGLGSNNMEHFSEQKDEEEEPVAKPVRRSPPSEPVQPQRNPSESFQNQSQPKEKEGFQNMYNNRRDYSFFDKMSMKRSDVVKLAMFSLVIVLAISIDRIGTHYISKYLADNIFTNFQEFMIRLAYPVVVFLVLWIVKSM